MNGLARKILIFALVMATVATAGWLGRKAYRRALERRLNTQARGYISKRDWRHASLTLQRALQVNPLSAETSSLLADFLETQKVPAALAWRLRAVQLAQHSTPYRLAWAKTALEFQDLKSAEEALGTLEPKDKTSAEYHKLAGALAWGSRNPEAAENEYTQALRLEPANQTIALNLATIHVASTNPAVANGGRLVLQQMTTNTEMMTTALRLLENEALARKSFTNALEYARKLADLPASLVPDQIDYLRLLRMTKSPGYDSCLGALERAAMTNSLRAFAVGRWLQTTENVTNALHWLRSLPIHVQTGPPVTLLVADCLVSLNDWPSLLAWIDHQDWADANYHRLALESLALHSLKQELAAKSAWQKAVRLADHQIDRMSRLAELTTTWGWKPERTEILSDIALEFPREKWATGLLEAHYYGEGNTAALAQLLSRSQASDPTDLKLKNDLANVLLLRKVDLEQACRMAHEAYEGAPDNPFFASTYAYALLLQHKSEDALRIMNSVRTNFLQIPSVAAYYGVVQARSGNKEVARESLKLVGKSPLLPEEKELVRLAQSQL